MSQRLALVGVKQNDVAGASLVFAQHQSEPDTIDVVGNLTALQRVSWPPPAEPPFLRNAFERCDREIVRPSRASISRDRRAKVQFVRFATGADSNGSGA